MKNKDFSRIGSGEKKSILARAIKRYTSLDDAEIIKAVNAIDVGRQYSIKEVTTEEFTELIKGGEKIISQTEEWEEKIISTATVLVNNDTGGIAVLEENHIGSLDLSKAKYTYSILVY